jgi:hypothetical protein
MWYANLRKNTRIGTLLVRRRLITTAQLHTAISLQRQRRGANLGDILIEQGWVTRHDIRWSLRRQAHLRYIAALLAMLCAPLQPVSAGSLFFTSANAENVAFADAELYANAPQLKLHDPNARSSKVNTSFSRAAQLTAKMMLKSWWNNYRAAASHELSPRPYSSKQTFEDSYSLRLREDKFLIRAKFRF